MHVCVYTKSSLSEWAPSHCAERVSSATTVESYSGNMLAYRVQTYCLATDWGGWKVVSCHSSAQSSSHEWACIAALERQRREAASPVWLYFYLSHRKERRRCRWTYMWWAMHTIHGLCRLCIERNLPQVCSLVFLLWMYCYCYWYWTAMACLVSDRCVA